MPNFKLILTKLHKNLNVLLEREAKYAGNAPLDVLNQISDHRRAIDLTKRVIKEDIAESQWQEEILKLFLPADLLDIVARFSPDLRLHEQAYRQRIKERYGENVFFYIPLTGETIESTQNEVPQSLSRRSTRRLHLRQEYREWTPERSVVKRIKFNQLEEVVEKYSCVILLGEPGSGKTTTLEYLAYKYAFEHKQIPVPLRLSEFVSGMTVEDFIEYSWGGVLEAGHWGTPKLASNLFQFLEEGKLFFLFDALNEMSKEGYELRVQMLRRFINKWVTRKNRFLVTCRVLDYEEQLSGLQRIEILPLNDATIMSFLQKELPKDWQKLLQEFRKRGLWTYARNPYMLTMMIDIFVEDKLLATSQAELMELFSRSLMRWTKTKLSRSDWLEIKFQQSALSVIAFEMQNRTGPGSVVRTELVKTIIPQQIQLDPAWPPQSVPGDQILMLAASANIIEMPINRSTVRFAHQLLQEYFSAIYIANNPTNEILEQVINDYGGWRETLRFTASLLKNTDTFFKIFRQLIDSLLYKSRFVEEVLRWSEGKLRDIETPFRRSALRAFSLFWVLNFIHVQDVQYDLFFLFTDPDYFNSVENFDEHDPSPSLSPALDLTRNLTLSLDPSLSDALDIVEVNVFKALALWDSNPNPAEYGGEPIRLTKQDIVNWWQNSSVPEFKLLLSYLEVNFLLIECLELANPYNKDEIKNNLFLFPDY